MESTANSKANAMPPQKRLDWRRRLVLGRLRGIRDGQLTLKDPVLGEPLVLGDQESELQAVVDIRSDRFYSRMIRGGSLGAAEAWIDGDWGCDDLTEAIRIMIRSMRVGTRLRSGMLDRGLAAGARQAARFRHWLRRNTLGQARDNIRRHYDLGNDFYSLWLDETLSYSCAVFPDSTATLAEASREKIDRACRQLQLGPEDHLLEIGTGWGSLAIRAVQEFGCRVTTTTISEEQYRCAIQRVHEAGLQDRIDVLKKDYRELEGRFDKLVSIEMIEAVGHEFLPTYFRQCSELLKPNGAMLLQAIVIADQQYDIHRRNADFISTYIFPGGALPSIAAISEVAAKSGGFRVACFQSYSAHYAETLRRWRSTFMERLDEVRALGFDEAFIRMWVYYLCYCEAAFEERQVNCGQFLLAKPGCRLDVIPEPSEAAVGVLNDVSADMATACSVPRSAESQRTEPQRHEGVR